MRDLWVTVIVAALAAGAGPLDEQGQWLKVEGGVRAYVNAPAAMDGNKPTLLIVYATPNGNTIEQTLGRAKTPGLDWHYDIQHVAAQVRRLREVDGRENLVLVVTEAPKLSWPAFRAADKDAGAIIRSVVDLAAKDLPGTSVGIVLTGHSGGGSFIFGYVNAAEAIPDSVRRIAFLDANYAYDDAAGHGDKFLAWLKADAARRLVVIAYDDREITLGGKKVVGPTGGTFRATGRMIERFKRDGKVDESTEGPFTHYAAAGGQVQCFVHGNPENKILHTTLVGEMNGLLHALTLGTPEEGKWGTFGGPRAYEKWIAAPAAEADPKPKIPDRPKDAPGGAAFAKQIEALTGAEREAAILKELTRGNVPDFLRALRPIDVRATLADGSTHVATYFVTPDYLAVGTDADFFRVPMTPMTARAVADAFDCAMITRKVSDDVYRHADVKLAPQPLTEAREASGTFYQHHRLIEAQRAETTAAGVPPAAPGAIVAGIKKDVVVSARLSEKPHRVAIYGWHKPDGTPIQPLTTVHVDWYVDYSHGVRLMSRRVMVDGRPTDAAAVLTDAQLCALLSDEGPINPDPPGPPHIRFP